jgi:hypothetical protein
VSRSHLTRLLPLFQVATIQDFRQKYAKYRLPPGGWTHRFWDGAFPKPEEMGTHP